VANDLDLEPARHVVDEITKAGGNAVICAGNVTDEGFGELFVGTATGEFGGLDIITLRHIGAPASASALAALAIDGSHPFYDTYVCADGKHVAVGAIGAQFFAELVEGLGLDPDPACPSVAVLAEQVDRWQSDPCRRTDCVAVP
jgi:hypothetical protein